MLKMYFYSKPLKLNLIDVPCTILLQFNDQWDWSLYLFLHVEKEPKYFENATLDCTHLKFCFRVKWIWMIPMKVFPFWSQNWPTQGIHLWNIKYMFVLQIITICYVYKMKKKTKKLLSCTWQFMFKSEIYLTDTSLLSVFFFTVHFLIV